MTQLAYIINITIKQTNIRNTTMGFIIGLTLVFASITGAFDQGQANQEAKNFLESKQTSYNPDTKVYGVDEVK